MTPLFDKDGKPNDAIEEIANGFEDTTRNFIEALTREGYSISDIREVGCYLMQAISGALSWGVIDARDWAAREAIRLADPNLTEQEIALIRDGKKIGAIKAYALRRMRTGVGLREAKDAVEKWMEENLGHK